MDAQHAQYGPPSSRAHKRARTAVACRRCKSRKQKCDGCSPTCSNCAGAASVCEYDLSMTLNRNQEQYLRARQRVDELEGILSRLTDIPGGKGRPPSASARVSSPFAPDHDGATGSTITASAPSPSAAGRSASADGDDASVAVLRHLSLQATGGYVDSSTIGALGRMLQAYVTPNGDVGRAPGASFFRSDMTPKSLDVLNPADAGAISLAGIPDVIADRMLEKGYFNYIATLWPLMPPNVVRRLHKDRSKLEDKFEIAALHLVYAAAGRFLETTGETGSFRSDKHYQAAADLLPDILALNGSVRVVQILLLLAIYSLRAPRGPGAWSYVGMAMRTCVELGMHRKCRDRTLDMKSEELQRRVFWSCYCLDRQVSIILGRPFAISDRDIDVDLPSGADEGHARDSRDCFVHICRLRIIESHIQQTIYRVDLPRRDQSTLDGVQDFIDQLEQWKLSIPRSDESLSSSSTNHFGSYMIYYHQAMRFLLHPHITAAAAQLRYMRLAVDACGGICQTYKRLHQNITVGFSLMALHAVFFAGLTMLYCAWKSPASILTNSTRNSINDCSIVLYIITERWPGAKKYRDLFEAIRNPVLDTIDQHQNTPQTAVAQLQPEVHDALRSISPAGAGQQEFATILMEMSGSCATRSQPRQQESQHQQCHSTLPAVDDSLMPGLAFDFSLPMDTDATLPFRDPFNPLFESWSATHNSSDAWTSGHRFSHSL